METQAITVRLPTDVYERLRLRAFETRISQSAIVVEAVREKLDREEMEERP
jgi:predicted transcriptional regulator